MTNLDFEAWRCAYYEGKFCPDEGCPKRLGCAREHGWRPGMPTPPEYISTKSDAYLAAQEKGASDAG